MGHSTPAKLKPQIRDKDLTGLKYFEKLLPLFERLHEVGCERDTAGNRDLHFDEYCCLVLLFFFNPIVDSLRALQQASELKSVQKKLGVPRTSLLKRRSGSGQVKSCLHTHFDVEKYAPDRIDVTPDAGGEHDERAVLERVLERDRLYVMDRGYAKFALFNAIVKHGSSYVCRLRDNSVYEIAEERPLTDADRAVDVLSDQIVRIGLSRPAAERPDHPVRLVIVKVTPHESRGKYRGGSSGVDSDGFLRIMTNRLDVPAEIIALLYQHRWQIEVFFRTLKHLLGCRHLLSHHPDGIKIQTYCAIIACLLINLWTGRQPTKRTHEMLCDYLMGWATEDELAAHLTKLQARDAAAAR